MRKHGTVLLIVAALVLVVGGAATAYDWQDVGPDTPNSISGTVREGTVGLPGVEVSCSGGNPRYYEDSHPDSFHTSQWEKRCSDVTVYGTLQMLSVTLKIVWPTGAEDWWNLYIELQAPDGSTKVLFNGGSKPYWDYLNYPYDQYADHNFCWYTWTDVSDPNDNWNNRPAGGNFRPGWTNKQVHGTWCVKWRVFDKNAWKPGINQSVLGLLYEPQVGTATTGADGKYTMTGDYTPLDSYLVVPQKAGYTFDPKNQSVVYPSYLFPLPRVPGRVVVNCDFAATGTAVPDTTPPQITAPSNVTAEQASRDGTAVNLGQPTVTDNEDPDPTVSSNAPSVFPLGTKTVIWTATDASANSATATQKVTIVDTTPPVLTVPADITQEQTSLTGTEQVDLGQATATDICDADVTITNDAPAVFPLGETVVTWTATDASGNVVTDTQKVTIVDTTKPTLTVPADVTAEQTNRDGTPVALGQATATDICDADVAITNDAPPVFPLGETTVTWTATDDAGNVTTATQKVTIVDTTKPELNVPGNFTGVEQTCAGGTYVDFEATATDVCDTAPTVVCVPPSHTEFPLGTTTVTVTATDASGNIATGTFTVTVVDTTAPQLTAPADVTAEQTSRDGTPVALGTPTASDICDTDVAVTNDAPAVFPLGTTTVTWTATDDSGNSVTATQTVTIVDTTKPDLTVAVGVTTEQTALAGTPVALGQAAATDICDADVAITNNAPAVFPLGVTTVTWTATDDSGNSVSATQTVTIVDTTKPDLAVPAAVTAEQTSAAGTPVAIGEATATDICDSDVTITNDAPAVFPLGTTTVTWTATDDSGNVTTATQKVTIVDTTKPELTVPGDVGAEQTSADGTPVDTGQATATDICDANPAVTNDAPAVFPLGTTTVTWTATDDSGNSVTATQTVTIVDTTKPDLTVLADVTAEQTSADGTPAAIGQATATDICDSDVTITNDAPAVFPLGTTTVTWTATDDSGNVVTAAQTVTIVDTTAPVIANVAANPSTLWPANHKLVSVVVSAQLTDICDAAPTWRITGVTCNQPVNGPGDGNTQPDWQITGDHTVKLRAERSGKTGDRIYTIWIAATDASGNSATASCTVVVPHDQGGGKK